MWFYLFIITLIFLIGYIHYSYKTKDPELWIKEGDYNPYNTYYTLVHIFGNPDTVDVASKGVAIWDEENIMDHKIASDNDIVRLELVDIPTKFLTVSFRRVLSDGDYISIRKKIPSMYDSVNKTLKIQGNSIEEVMKLYNSL